MKAPFSNFSTSLEGAKYVESTGRADTQQAMILAAIRKAGKDGITDGYLSEVTGIPIRQVSARRRALVLGGFVKDSGRTRTGKSGVRNIVWVEGMELHAPKPRKKIAAQYGELAGILRQMLAVSARTKTMIYNNAADFAVWARCVADARRILENG